MFDGCLFYIWALLEVYSIFELSGKYIIHVHNWCSFGQLTLFWNTDLDTELLIFKLAVYSIRVFAFHVILIKSN